MQKKTTGAWLIHHAKKLSYIANPTRFDRVVTAGKAGILLSGLAESERESTLPSKKVEAIASAAGISPGVELPTLLAKLEAARLINRSQGGDVTVLGLTTATVLQHTADIFTDAGPTPEEEAVIDLAEQTSNTPAVETMLSEYLGDAYKLPKAAVGDLLEQSERIGFVDSEPIGDDKLYFNGNLFRREEARKAAAVLGSLGADDVAHVKEVEQLLRNQGCISRAEAVKRLGEDTLLKLQSIGMYDVSSVCNEVEESLYLTRPSAFNKYGNALVEDALDLAKAFVASLTYGMTRRPSAQGRIRMFQLLLDKLLRGQWVGPATAIGQDYKILELKRVIEVRPQGNIFNMRLLKMDVGELARQAITEGDVSEASLMLPGAAVAEFRGPERNRVIIRQKQEVRTRREVADLLRTLRTGDSQ